MHPPCSQRRNAPLQTEYLATSTLAPIPGAPREHPKSQIRALTKSFEAFGQVLPILIDPEGRIISGAAQWDVAKRLGMLEVMVIRVEYLSEPQIKALMVALNRLGDLSKWNEQALSAILLDLHELDLDFDIEASGYTEIEIELRIEGIDDLTEPEDDQVLVGDGPTVTRLGDLWQLGNHRLLCADTLKKESWLALMGEDLAALVVTDSPFNVPIDGHVTGQGKFKHRPFQMAAGEMSPPQFTAFLSTSMEHAHRWSKPGLVHVWAMDWRHANEITSAGQAVYERYLNMAVWVKDRPELGLRFQSQSTFRLQCLHDLGCHQPQGDLSAARFSRQARIPRAQAQDP